MIEYTVKSIPIGDVITNLADGMGVKYFNKCSYYELNLPEHIGTGTIHGIQYDSGFALLNYECKFNVRTKINFTFNQVHPMKFIHCHGGTLEHYFEKNNRSNKLDTYENIVVASTRNNGHSLEFKAGILTKLCSIEIDREKFKNKISCFLDLDESSVVDAIKDEKADKQFYMKGSYNIAISNIIQKLTENRNVALDTILLKEGESYKLLAYQWMEFSSDHSKSVLKRHEYDVYLKVRSYIEENISQPLTLNMLTKAFLVSAKVIQKLFKSISGKTVNAYIQNYRLEKAIELLADENNNISEVVYKLGLKNRSYFTRAFKARYNVTPSDYVNNVMKHK